MGVGRCLEWGAMNLRGAVGGVVVFWATRCYVGDGSGEFLILCCFKNYEDDFCWSFTGVYGSTLKKDRESFWGELGVIRGLWSDPWYVANNFNMIRFPSECCRGGRLSSIVRRFS